MTWKKSMRFMRTVLFALVFALLFRSYLFASYVVDGKSMEPTLYDGNLLMVNKVIYDWNDVNHLDVVVFHYNEQEDYVKRVIGLPGDTIEYREDTLYLNGQAVNEDYLDPFRPENGEALTQDFTLTEVTGEKTVPDGSMFVLGDNRAESLDSRYFGFVPIDSIVGKVDVRYWPISQVSLSFL
ncbi:signal peptidase [Pontibacillus halophilus JSM 076056 = DSM 19796]|uniref:Signal peptidase I n=1 Tax=Pontibacillus halophilus JSM 076056 = DSM 19796 TaxID=1385510 RepID=A0A0A5GN97_9BACI|nr:signal peptidase I [Pontibacillus halophilus]KGX92635.1 signal peptidase [Pontibacillus halophilus JSM 076056 = DSM 19796]